MTVDEGYMRQALELATKDGSNPSVSPIGCVIVMEGKVVASERNEVAARHGASRDRSEAYRRRQIVASSSPHALRNATVVFNV